MVIEIALAFLGGGPIISKLKNVGKTGIFAKTAKVTGEFDDITDFARYGEKVGEDLTDAKEAVDSAEFIKDSNYSKIQQVMELILTQNQVEQLLKLLIKWMRQPSVL